MNLDKNKYNAKEQEKFISGGNLKKDAKSESKILEKAWAEKEKAKKGRE